MNSDLQEVRVCSGCGAPKPLSDFPVTRGKRFFRCKECSYSVIRAWHLNHQERVLEIKRNHRAKNHDAELERARERSKMPANRAKRREYLRKWRASNPGINGVYLARRRCRTIASVEHYTLEDVQRIYREQKGRCAEPTCAVKLSGKYHVDHIMPLALGGSNGAGNIQILCPRCNAQKNAKHPVEWAQMHGRLF